MSDHGSSQPDDNDDSTPNDKKGDDAATPNPFAGTPFEALFSQFENVDVSGLIPGMGQGQVPDMNAIIGQVQRMFAERPSGSGPIDPAVTLDVARRTTAATGADPSPTASQQAAVADAVTLAEMWLDEVTELPRGATTSAAWSRAEWIENTSSSWHTLAEPIAEHVSAAMETAMPPELKAMAGPLLGILTQAGGAMFAQQLGRGLGELAAEVLSSTDIGLPLGPTGVAAVLPSGIAGFGEGLELRHSDVMLYVVLRECAHHRLFSAAPWLKGALVSAVAEFGRGTRIDLEAVERRITDLDVSQPDDIMAAMQNGLFDPDPTPEQQQALARLEHLLALVEGWVDEVVTQATAERMPTAAALAETMRRRRATGGPAEQTFASLVGLRLRPRRLRDAANLWAAVRDQHGAAGRDQYWLHPDVMPTPDDLDDPLAFAENAAQAPEGDEFDDALRKLLDEEQE